MYFVETDVQVRSKFLTLVCIGGGGGCFFCYSSKTVGTRLLKLCDFYSWPITHHLVYLLVTKDLNCCHGNLIFIQHMFG